MSQPLERRRARRHLVLLAVGTVALAALLLPVAGQDTTGPFGLLVRGAALLGAGAALWYAISATLGVVALRSRGGRRWPQLVLRLAPATVRRITLRALGLGAAGSLAAGTLGLTGAVAIPLDLGYPVATTATAATTTATTTATVPTGQHGDDARTSATGHAEPVARDPAQAGAIRPGVGQKWSPPRGYERPTAPPPSLQGDDGDGAVGPLTHPDADGVPASVGATEAPRWAQTAAPATLVQPHHPAAEPEPQPESENEGTVTDPGPNPVPAATETTPAPVADATSAPATHTALSAAEHATQYVVQPGDSLWKIAVAHGADSDAEAAAAWPRWWEHNRAAIGDNPDLIHPGLVLEIPPELEQL